MPGTTVIPIINNGDMLKDVRLIKLNPVIEAVNALSADLIRDETDITSMKTQLTTNTTTINQLSTEVSDLTAKVTTISDNVDQNTLKVNQATVTNTAQDRTIASLTSSTQTLSDRISVQETFNTRVKSGLDLGNMNITLQAGTPVNLVMALKQYSPIAGSWGPYFDLTNNKIKVAVNDNRTVHVKIVLIGVFAGAPSNDTAGLQFHVSGGVNDHYDSRRTNLSTTEFFKYLSFFSVDKDDLFTQQGATLEVVAINRNFTIQGARIIIEQ